eukprot:10007346-Alexandrium_andersonii.AAC.1
MKLLEPETAKFKLSALKFRTPMYPCRPCCSDVRLQGPLAEKQGDGSNEVGASMGSLPGGT